MKLFLADGRLGNQIFQYVFLKTIQKNNEKIIVSGFEELRGVFEIDDIVNINKKNILIRVFLFGICRPVLIFLSNKKVISSVTINYEKVLDKYKRESVIYNETMGFFKRISFVKLGFFQSEKFFRPDIANKLKLKKKYVDNATKVLNHIDKESHKVFIHIRRGDYKDYTVYGKSTLLPMCYYMEQLEWFVKNKKNCFFIFLSDDTEFIKKQFESIENKLIATNNHVGTDLAIMTKCNSAILSPSSFGWWGSYLMKERDTVFAPKYWLGFSSKIEYHGQGTPYYVKEIEI